MDEDRCFRRKSENKKAWDTLLVMAKKTKFAVNQTYNKNITMTQTESRQPFENSFRGCDVGIGAPEFE